MVGAFETLIHEHFLIFSFKSVVQNLQTYQVMLSELTRLCYVIVFQAKTRLYSDGLPLDFFDLENP